MEKETGVRNRRAVETKWSVSVSSNWGEVVGKTFVRMIPMAIK